MAVKLFVDRRCLFSTFKQCGQQRLHNFFLYPFKSHEHSPKAMFSVFFWSFVSYQNVGVSDILWCGYVNWDWVGLAFCSSSQFLIPVFNSMPA